MVGMVPPLRDGRTNPGAGTATVPESARYVVDAIYPIEPRSRFLLQSQHLGSGRLAPTQPADAAGAAHRICTNEPKPPAAATFCTNEPGGRAPAAACARRRGML